MPSNGAVCQLFVPPLPPNYVPYYTLHHLPTPCQPDLIPGTLHLAPTSFLTKSQVSSHPGPWKAPSQTSSKLTPSLLSDLLFKCHLLVEASSSPHPNSPHATNLPLSLLYFFAFEHDHHVHHTLNFIHLLSSPSPHENISPKETGIFVLFLPVTPGLEQLLAHAEHTINSC